MKQRLIKKMMWVPALALFSFTTIYGQAADLSYDDFDRNNSNTIELDEFILEISSDLYSKWDVSNDYYLDNDDFYKSAFQVWDKDKDNFISEAEWTKGYDHMYGSLSAEDYGYDYDATNTNSDGYVDKTEFDRVLEDDYLFGEWDTNGDDRLTNMEWDKGLESYNYGLVDYDYGEIDVNDDMMIDLNEFEAIMNGSEFFQQWDTDNSNNLTNEELAIGIFHMWDADHNGTLEENEFEEFDSFIAI